METIERDYQTISASVNTDDLKYMKENDLSATVIIRTFCKKHRQNEIEKKQVFKLKEIKTYFLLFCFSIIFLFLSSTMQPGYPQIAGYVTGVGIFLFALIDIIIEGVNKNVR